jgi:hypothetical protein
MPALLVGIITSIPASILTLLVTNLDDVRYLLSSRKHHQHLNGTWRQYHLTTDSSGDAAPAWVSHTEQLKITKVGRVKGTSAGEHSIALKYGVKGVIRHGVMRLTLSNQTATEDPVTIFYPHLLSSDMLVGTWAGRDFDGRWSTGPIVLSRRSLSRSELDAIAIQVKVLRVFARRAGEPPALAA